MEIDNQTNDPIDYDQSGTGPGLDPQKQDPDGPEGPPCPVTGNVPPQAKAQFPPCGRPPFTVVVSGAGGSCTQAGIVNPRAILRVESLDPCVIVVENPGGS